MNQAPSFPTRPERCPACGAGFDEAERAVSEHYAVYACGAHAYPTESGDWRFHAWPACRNAFAAAVQLRALADAANAYRAARSAYDTHQENCEICAHLLLNHCERGMDLWAAVETMRGNLWTAIKKASSK